MTGSPGQAPGDAGATATVRLGVILLCHGHLGRATKAARLWADGGAAVVVHIDANTARRSAETMQAALADLPRVWFSRRRPCRWGDFSLVDATQDAAELLLAEFPDVSHVYLASGSCLPLRPVAALTDWLARDPGCDRIESVNALDAGWTVDGLDIERFTLVFPFDWHRNRRLFDLAVRVQRRLGFRRRLPRGMVPHIGSQWWCLTAASLRAILTDPRRAEFERFFRRARIPDESYFQTLVRRHSTRIESRSPTFARFDMQGRPALLYDDHRDLLEQSGCFVARKIWRGAEGLYAHFPRPAPAEPAADAPAEPDPYALEQVIGAASNRRRQGRPGLYMQSRFPRTGLEGRRTAAPYAVLQGFCELFPDFEPWLAARVRVDVHGHIMSRDEVEFAGRPAVGPGGWPPAPGLRDLDPRGFLAALTRTSPRMQAFQFSTGDRRALNTFVAGDQNARVFIITGAWVAPLLRAEMPFDDVRRIAARMQRVERAQVDGLNAAGVRAAVWMWPLTDFIERPADFLTQVVRILDRGAAPVAEAPPMRPLDGLAPLLEQLRNAGLLPYLAGTPHRPFLSMRPPAAQGPRPRPPRERDPGADQAP